MRVSDNGGWSGKKVTGGGGSGEYPSVLVAFCKVLILQGKRGYLSVRVADNGGAPLAEVPAQLPTSMLSRTYRLESRTYEHAENTRVKR